MLQKFVVPAVLLAATSVTHAQGPCAPDVPALEDLGKQVFFDPISRPFGQSCASCHAPATGFTGASSLINATSVASRGANPFVAGGRKPPTVTYASFAPVFGAAPGRICNADNSAASCKGGLFWDGRATGTLVGPEVFGDQRELALAYQAFLGPAADQALGPFANPVEMNVPRNPAADGGVPGAEFVCMHVARSRYAKLFERAWGEAIACDPAHAALSFKRIALAISAWEHSAEVNSFSSKRDLALQDDRDETPGAFPLQGLTDQENLGHDLFYGLKSALNPEGKDARCNQCHNNHDVATSRGEEPDQIYTDHRFHHLGLPPNHQASSFDPSAPDVGLSQHTDPEKAGNGSRHDGAFRTPTLRNLDKRPYLGFVKSFMHNGYFKRLEDVVHFYNTAIVKLDPVRCPPGTTAEQARARDCWPAPEVSTGTRAPLRLMGDLGLTSEQEAALVAYLKSLTDTETVKAPSHPHSPWFRPGKHWHSNASGRARSSD